MAAARMAVEESDREYVCLRALLDLQHSDVIDRDTLTPRRCQDYCHRQVHKETAQQFCEFVCGIKHKGLGYYPARCIVCIEYHSCTPLAAVQYPT